MIEVLPEDGPVEGEDYAREEDDTTGPGRARLRKFRRAMQGAASQLQNTYATTTPRQHLIALSGSLAVALLLVVCSLAGKGSRRGQQVASSESGIALQPLHAA